MDALQTFKQNLDTLRNKRAVLEAKISSEQAAAAKLKARLQSLGYNSIAEAIEDYKRRVADLPEKQALVENLIHQIETVDTLTPSREEILAKLRQAPESTASISEDIFNVPEVLTAPPVEEPSDPIPEAKVEETPEPVPDMFPGLKFNL